MVFTSSRKKNSKFYWLELGFIALGIIGWNPSIITNLLESKGTAIIQQQFPPQYSQQGYNQPGYNQQGYNQQGYQGYNQLASNRGYSGQPFAQNPFDPANYQTGNDPSLYSNLQNTAGQIGQYALTAASQLLRPNVNNGGTFPTTSYDPMMGQRSANSVDPYAYNQSQAQNLVNPAYGTNQQQWANQQYYANQQNQSQQPFNYGAQNTSGSQYGYPVSTGFQNSQPNSSGYWSNGYPANTTAPATTVPPATLNSQYNPQSTFSNWPSTTGSTFSQQNRGYSNGFPTTANLQTSANNSLYPTYGQYGAGQYGSYGQYGAGNASQYQNAAYPTSTGNFNPASTNVSGFVPAGSTANSLGAQPNRYGYSNGYQPLNPAAYQPLNPATNGTRGRY